MTNTPLRTVLVIEDDAMLGLLLREVLSDEGYRVLPASSSDYGLDLAASDRPDVIVLDLGFPETVGMCTLNRLKRDHVTADIPVIALTDRPASPGNGTVAPDGRIQKPFDIDALVAQVGGWTAGPAPNAAPISDAAPPLVADGAPLTAAVEGR